jgi:hypothetical protein
VWTRLRRGGSGIGPACALLLAYAPMLAAVALAAVSFSHGIGQRSRVGLTVAAVAALVAEYLAWITDTQVGWGITSGPEVTLWCAVVGAALVARNVTTDAR